MSNHHSKLSGTKIYPKIKEMLIAIYNKKLMKMPLNPLKNLIGSKEMIYPLMIL